MLLQMTEERPYWSLQQQHARAGSRWQRGRAPLLSWVMRVRIRALLHILLNRAVHVAVCALASRTCGPSIKDRAALLLPSSPACISAYNPAQADVHQPATNPKEHRRGTEGVRRGRTR